MFIRQGVGGVLKEGIEIQRWEIESVKWFPFYYSYPKEQNING